MKTVNTVVWFLIIIRSSIGKNYTDYTLFRTVPITENQLQFLKNLSEKITMDFWLEPGAINKPVDVLINPADKKLFMRSMDDKDYHYTTIMDDVQSAFDLQTIKPYVRRKMESFSWTNYYNLDDIYAWMKDLAQSHPGEITIMRLGITYENRKILCLKVVFKGSRRRSAVIIESGIHAREWISIPVVTYFLDQLVQNKNKPKTPLGKIANIYEFYFIPILNPDGYKYSMEKDRLWRKNRNGGYGVDINRNFDAGFGTTGISFDKTTEIYCGPRAFSERESQAIRKLTNSLRDNIEYYMAFHSYGQYMIIPYAHNKEHLANYDEVYQILVEARKKLSQKFRTKYTIGTAFETVGYTSSGVSGCWAKKEYLIPCVVTFELRDSGEKGFTLPPNQITPTSVETLDAIISILTSRKTKFINTTFKNNLISKATTTTTKATQSFQKLKNIGPLSASSVSGHFKIFVIFMNFVFFIIVR